MNSREGLSQLKDIHLPEPVSWWPPAPGWWLLSLAFLLGLLGMGLLFRRWQQRKYRRTALRELRRLQKNPAGLTERQRGAEVAELLRRVALVGFGRARVAPLSGAAWLAFLDQTGQTDQFTSGPGQSLGDDLYRVESEVDLAQLLPLVEQWIRRHRGC